ncbi:MAG: NAD(P)H-hydrate dehydratase, partial [Pseudomonadales bacterium]|nr:NAD(P)H-hydrate dehydratase [Pseudomonadales bacterium]
RSYDVLVDALLGTGTQGSPRSAIVSTIAAINSSQRPVLALDLPSGIDADTGNVLGTAAVCATHCISFVGAKRGLYTGQGDHHAGRMVVDNLGIEPDANILRACHVRDLVLPAWEPRQRQAHKGNYGHVLVLGGQKGMSGAAMLAARAAARAGAGWVSVGAQATTVQALAIASPEIMAREVDDDSDLEHLLQRATLIVLGPGLGKDAWSERLYKRALTSGLPLVIDADALHLLAAHPQRLTQAIMTPHPGEAAVLLGVHSDHIQADRFAAAAALHERYGSVVVLKGNGTLIAHEGGMVLCRYGNPGMATAGMGDVLSGLMGGLWAQGLSVVEAAGRSVMVHARTADRLASRGERGLLASDLSENWQEELASCR